MSQDSKSLSDTPMTDEREFDATYADDKGNVVPADFSRELERDNARLREEVEMLNVRHAASMLHAQTHADEYNALREDEKGLLQDIQRLTEEAFKRDEELAEAKRGSTLHSEHCPKCKNSEKYYFLKNSGRCHNCHFWWGIAK